MTDYLELAGEFHVWIGEMNDVGRSCPAPTTSSRYVTWTTNRSSCLPARTSCGLRSGWAVTLMVNPAGAGRRRLNRRRSVQVAPLPL